MFEKLFPEYFRPSEADFKRLWAECRFVPDACVLLDLYRYTEGTRAAFLEVLDGIKERLWLPHQAAKEYARNRHIVIAEQGAILGRYKSAIAKGFKDLREDLLKATNRREHPVATVDELWTAVEAAVESHLATLHERQSRMLTPSGDDPILGRLRLLFDGRVGTAFDEASHRAALKEGDERSKKRTPPGFMDEKKEGDDKYGDWLVWKQMILMAHEWKRPIIFITSDAKEDWWWFDDRNVVGPRPELLAEMRSVAGVDCYLYQPNRFLEFAREFLKSTINERVIDEVRDVQALGRTVAAEEMDAEFELATYGQVFNDVGRLEEQVEKATLHLEQLKAENRKLDEVQPAYERLRRYQIRLDARRKDLARCGARIKLVNNEPLSAEETMLVRWGTILPFDSPAGSR